MQSITLCNMNIIMHLSYAVQVNHSFLLTACLPPCNLAPILISFKCYWCGPFAGFFKTMVIISLLLAERSQQAETSSLLVLSYLSSFNVLCSLDFEMNQKLLAVKDQDNL